ncbi:hypothetical protein [Yinghuangia soli]|uniref:Secreted protein n=1 Tax=Yinghuangia soli TaxID=2908204 RepID=A0AA41U3F2_9ACTN|nr:hypothetical protein [Yinghuangia soli]MCF2529637.1 hypothetical protein [Yinghuangia soli]
MAAAGVAGAVIAAVLPATAAATANTSGTAHAGEAGRRPASVTVERGHALGCQGSSAGVEVAVELYENSEFGTHASVFVQSPDGAYRGGYGPGDTGIFRHGRIAAAVALEPMGEPGGAEPGATAAPHSAEAVVTGTYVRSGRPTPVHEVIEDAGQTIVIDGLNTALRTAATVAVLGRTIPLTCDTAFAFDLLVRKYPMP